MSDHSEACEAPLCFESGAADGLTGIWYPDEPVCTLRDGLSGPFRRAKRVQRKIQRVGADAERYWTFEELVSIRSVRRGSRGKHHCDEEVA